MQAQQAALPDQLAPRLWQPPTVAAGWLGTHQQTLDRLAALLARLKATRAGFAEHPVDDDLPAVAPPPLSLDAA